MQYANRLHHDKCFQTLRKLPLMLCFHTFAMIPLHAPRFQLQFHKETTVCVTKKSISR